MYFAWPSIPSWVCWTPHLGGDRRRPISYPPPPPPAWAVYSSQGYAQENQAAAQAGVWSMARCRVTDQNTRGRIQLEERSVCAGFPGEASWRWHELRQALATAQGRGAGRPVQEGGPGQTRAEKQQ